MIEFVIKGDISLSDAQAVARKIAGKHKSELLKVSLGMVDAVPTPAEPVTVLVGIAGAVASVISAFVVVFVEIRKHRQDKTWTVERLKKLIEQEMIRFGIVNFAIDSVDNFDELRCRSGTCVIEVTDIKTKNEYRMYIFRDGEPYVLRVETVEQQS